MSRHGGGQRPGVQEIEHQASNSYEAARAVSKPHFVPHLYFSNPNPKDAYRMGLEEGPSESSSSSSLSGDYELYTRCLQYGRFR
ncbi:hypothetical protein CASFOL_040059 [Castilleja foliolosa]|uniref:Uncharacterized protein n=1 Tax=Castilleja foliolosa TaxID=1961234 RepID=A0ABD3BEG4_9LAMI